MTNVLKFPTKRKPTTQYKASVRSIYLAMTDYYYNQQDEEKALECYRLLEGMFNLPQDEVYLPVPGWLQDGINNMVARWNCSDPGAGENDLFIHDVTIGKELR